MNGASSEITVSNPAEILAAQEHFGFARPTAIEKDWHIGITPARAAP
jgi:hypothetical protein